MFIGNHTSYFWSASCSMQLVLSHFGADEYLTVSLHTYTCLCLQMSLFDPLALEFDIFPPVHQHELLTCSGNGRKT